jgi:hypothetical protein
MGIERSEVTFSHGTDQRDGEGKDLARGEGKKDMAVNGRILVATLDIAGHQGPMIAALQFIGRHLP